MCVGHPGARLIGPSGRGVTLGGISDIDAPVLDARLVARGRLRGSNVEPTVDLSRVGAQDHRAVVVRELDGERRLASARRSTNDTNATFARNADRAHPR